MVLLEARADVNVLDHNFESPLSLFAFHVYDYDSSGVASELIRHGAKVDLHYCYGEDGDYGDTPLHTLVRKGKYQKAKEILDAKPESIMLTNRMGKLPREVVTHTFDDKMLKLLVSQSAIILFILSSSSTSVIKTSLVDYMIAAPSYC